MPRGDRTGPAGMGPMTGRAAGRCAGNLGSGAIKPDLGRGFVGRGRGRGWRNRYFATGLTGWQRAALDQLGPEDRQPDATPDVGQVAAPRSAEVQDVDLLKRQAEYLEGELKDLKARLEKFDSQPQQE